MKKINENICLIVNTHSSCKDLWKIFFDRIEEYFCDIKTYVFSDSFDENIPEYCDKILYNKDDVYADQFYSCIKGVSEKYCIYVSEDYILYDKVNVEKINYFLSILKKENEISFIRFMKGGIEEYDYKEYKDNLFYLPLDKEYFYNNQAALWKTCDLKDIHENGPKLHIANLDWQNSFEYKATEYCRKKSMNGLFYFNGEKKRGIYHYDCSVFPYIATALVKGKWNVGEYSNELFEIFRNYEINPYSRGIV